MSEKWMEDLAEIVHVKCHATVDRLKAELAAEAAEAARLRAVVEALRASNPATARIPEYREDDSDLALDGD